MSSLAQATLDALPESICLLDAQGVILFVNRAWLDFARANGVSPTYRFVGSVYGAAGGRPQDPDVGLAEAFRAGLADVLAGRRQAFTLEYPCHGLGVERWFTATATRYHEGAQLHVAVSHADVTPRHRAEEAMTATRRQLADLLAVVQRALPLARALPEPEAKTVLGEAAAAAEKASMLLNSK
jgi:PAS domain-containing protein